VRCSRGRAGNEAWARAGAGGEFGGEGEPAAQQAEALAQLARHYGAGSAQQAQREREAEEDLCFELGEFEDMASECKAVLALLQERVDAARADREPGDGGAAHDADVAVGGGVAGGGDGGGGLAWSTLPASPSSASERGGGGPGGGGSGVLSEDLLSVLSEQERSLLEGILPL